MFAKMDLTGKVIRFSGFLTHNGRFENRRYQQFAFVGNSHVGVGDRRCCNRDLRP